MLGYLKALPYIAIGILVVLLSLTYADSRTLKANLTTIKGQLKICQDVNITDEKTITDLKAAVIAANALCVTESKITHTTDSKIEQISELPIIVPTPKNKSEVTPNETANSIVTPSSSSDPIFNELNIMFTNSANSQGQLHQATSSASTPGPNILSCQMAGNRSPVRLYCIDGENAKNLLKDIALSDGYQDTMKAIIDSMQ